MCHSLASLQHRHFNTRRIGGPETCLFTFRGADAFSFGEGIRLQHELISRLSESLSGLSFV